MIVIVVVVVTPVGVVWGLAKSSQLRGPAARPESRRRVQSLVTDAVPEEPRDGDGSVEGGDEIARTASPPASERPTGEGFER